MVESRNSMDIVYMELTLYLCVKAKNDGQWGWAWLPELVYGCAGMCALFLGLLHPPFQHV